MGKKGLSLLEILVATILFALVISGLANIFVAAKRYVAHNRGLVAAGEAGRMFLEPLNSQIVTSRYSDTNGDGYLEWQPTYPGAWSDTASQTTFTPSYTIDPMDLDNDPYARTSEIQRVSVTIRWNERTAQ
jgi:Tfp pilus assembly protein PilV